MAQAEKSKVMSIGWTCFWVGVAIMLLIHTSILFSGPFFLAAFILSIVGITQSRVTSGVVLLLATLIVPPVIFFATFALSPYDDPVTESVTEWEEERLKKERERREALRNVVIEDVKGELGRTSMVVEGKVRNKGIRRVENVKVSVEWMDKNGKVLDTDWTYAVSSVGLRPGGAKSFRISTRLDKKAERFWCRIIKD